MICEDCLHLQILGLKYKCLFHAFTDFQAVQYGLKNSEEELSVSNARVVE